MFTSLDKTVALYNKVSMVNISYMNLRNTVKPNIIQTPDIIFDIFLLVGVGDYSSFM